ncbi:hypothetical protein H6P81_020572 [Aristolochia fimbriata]|uniref:C2H2-type domain-containing protein n=1 Tax=Aristolochia fimbriata TaxID=158543 RepID=A0AAV7DUT6_ARIFI|nr:hypothetical protein H6P81_020572 [Aristolochia fimbriata]
MVRGDNGVWTAKPKRVVVLWDLDNKPPRGPPYSAAMALRRIASRFGDVVDVSAYANRHAFVHLPNWVVEHRRERRELDRLERKGLAAPSEPYVCSVCGRKCRTHPDLKKHFKQLHERERQKKLSRMRSLKGKKRQKYKERFISGNHKYDEAARELLTPRVGYGLASELRRAGVFVKTVEDKPQAADAALKRQMQHSMTSGVDWLLLVSDDSDFSDMLRRARESDLGTVVIGDGRRALGREADIWVPWSGVESGEISDDMLKIEGREEEAFVRDEGGFFTTADFVETDDDEESDVDEIVVERFGRVRISAFSEDEGWAGEDGERDYSTIHAVGLDDDDDESEEDDDRTQGAHYQLSLSGYCSQMRLRRDLFLVVESGYSSVFSAGLCRL